MPASKVSFKTNRFDFEVENVEFTAGPEIVKVGHLKGSLDVADLLRIRLPEMAAGRGTGVMITSYGAKKIQVIKDTRNFTGWGLKEAKSAIESLPLFIPTCGKVAAKVPGQNVPKVTTSKKDMEEFVAQIEESDGSASICRADSEGPMVLDVLRDLLSEALAKEVES
jgi:ribosomal protein L7/L12